MGFFSGLLGAVGLGGGSKTNVSQQSTNRTDVQTTTNVDNYVLVDNEPLANAVKFLGKSQQDAGTATLASGIINAQVLKNAEANKLKSFNSAITKFLKLTGYLGVGGLLLYGANILYKKRKK